MKPTAPLLARAPMRARPWFGFLRGLLFALWPGMRFESPGAGQPAPAWAAAARRRRRVLLACTVLLGASAAALGHAAGIAPGWPLVLATVLFAWVGVGLITALMGAWVMLRGDAHALRPAGRAGEAPLSRGARTALIMPICNEDIATVFGGLRATCESLAATGALSLFDIYVLSDTGDTTLRAAELNAWRELRASLGDGPDAPGGRIFYRSRRHRTERKAGNVSDFCRRWGRNYRYMVVLDADSTMHGDTLVSLVRLMEENPRAGILQTLPQPVGHDTLHARAQQFGTRVTGRLFALGMAYWQLGDSHYWGHNAILRVAPFMAHCRMAALPGRGGLSGHIMSHDFVEAAMMRRAGYEVWVLPDLGGSWEQTPPNLLDELQRDRRWCQGNLQNARLIAEPGWTPAHRAMFATGAMSYLAAPMWLALLGSGALAMAQTEGVTLANGVLWSLTLTLLLLPRVLGVVAVLLQGSQAAHGGTARLVASSVLEAALSALQAPVRMLAHTSFVISALTGLRLEWRSPPRDARAVPWGDAVARVGVLALPVLAVAWLLLPGASSWAWPLLPVLVPLALAVPMAVSTGSARLGAAARRLGLLVVGEELRPPRALLQAKLGGAFAALQPAPKLQPARPRLALMSAWAQGAWAAGVTALLVVAVVPRPVQGPELDAETLALAQQHVQQQRVRESEFALTHVVPQQQVRRVASARRTLPERPARYIDEDVRRRAMQAVERALEAEGVLMLSPDDTTET